MSWRIRRRPAESYYSRRSGSRRGFDSLRISNSAASITSRADPNPSHAISRRA